METYVGEPYVYTVDAGNENELRNVIERILTSERVSDVHFDSFCFFGTSFVNVNANFPTVYFCSNFTYRQIVVNCVVFTSTRCSVSAPFVVLAFEWPLNFYFCFLNFTCLD